MIDKRDGSKNGSRNMLCGDVSSHRGGTAKENQSRSKLSGFDQSTIPLIINEFDNHARTRSPTYDEGNFAEGGVSTEHENKQASNAAIR